MISPWTRQILRDPGLPGSAALIDDVPGPLAAAYKVAGSTLTYAEPMQITWWPGRRLTIRYRSRAHGGVHNGETQAVASIGSMPEGAVLVEGDDSIVGVWCVPHDPALPGLASALDTSAVTGLLRQLGSTDIVTRTRLRAYRPGSRAVVEAKASGASLFLKVVPPAKVVELHERHRHLAAHLPVPDSLGLSTELGIVAMRTAPGVDLRARMRRGGALPESADIAAMLAGLPNPVSPTQVRSSLQSLPQVIEVLHRLLPEEAGPIERLAAEIGPETVDASVAVHGDFHEAQILVEGVRPGALVDVDTYGWGRPGDDPATMLAHLDLLAPSCPRPQVVRSLAHGLNRIWDRTADPADLRRRTAAVALGLAVGPFRVQGPNWPDETRRRVRAAARWAESARRVDEGSLIAASGASHVRAAP